MSNVVDIIKNEDLSLDELGEIIKESLSKMYSKLETDIGMHDPIGVIKCIGRNSYDVNVSFINRESYEGESYEQVYHV